MAYLYEIPDHASRMGVSHLEHDRLMSSEEFTECILAANRAAGFDRTLGWLTGDDGRFLESLSQQGFRPPAAAARFIPKDERP